ncbi:MAG: TlpA disulfide reductase family protein [Dysgonomonas sp.]|nr:TlpA disulfide reductase family protein [Dysgonomonas sp.]
MKTRSLIFIAMAICLCFAISCKKEPAITNEYTIEGNADSAMIGKIAYLIDYNTSLNIDSARIDSGKFVFKGIADSVRYCRISIGREYASLILEGGNIVVDMEKHNATGTPLNEILTNYNQKRDSIILFSYNMHKTLKEEKDPAKLKEKIDSFYSEWKPAYENIIDNAFDANKDNLVGMVVASDISRNASTGRMDTIFSMLGKDILARNMVQTMVARNELLKKTAPGQKFTDFAIVQKDGSEDSLSDYAGKGKYVLVDFWASWCGPCRDETPYLKELYKKYKGDKFEIVGVAVWDGMDNSLKAIKEDNISWPQILGAGEIAQKAYGVNGIPHIMLIGPDGTILERNLRGETMVDKVAQLLK